ncbi:MAG: endonuclease/exonuclease/phosphatase family protein [Rhodospirillales bacterium]
MTRKIVLVATYNIHRAVGTDRRYDLGRVLTVLDEMQSMIVALQEVGTPVDGEGPDQFECLHGHFGGEAVIAPTIDTNRQRYGNCILSRYPIVSSEIVDLGIAGREPRNAIDAVIAAPRGAVRVLATHFGLGRGERRYQAEVLQKRLEHESEVPTLVMGDFNEWRQSSPLFRMLGMGSARRSRVASYPARLPVLPLDRILWRPDGLIGRLWTIGTGIARSASDHLPVMAEIS